ncbi:MAG: hypothetical protein KJ066_19495 [Acidobacteria bacterium]|nr:hypothetical protein [Acidobacteriota bacterium]
MARYVADRNQMVRGEDVVLLPAAARTQNAAGAAVPSDEFSTAVLELDVTARSGTNPTLDVAIETRFSGFSTWVEVDTFAQATNVGAQRKVVSGLADEVRAVGEIGGTGTPTFTYGVRGHLK